MTFRDKEKERYRELKTKLFTHEAQRDGNCRGRPRFFCLADDHSDENLYRGIRESAIEYFRARSITWHDGLKGRHFPSNHLCCSQSCCMNSLYPMTTKPEVLANVFRYFYPNLAKPLLIDKDVPLPNGTFPYVAFEWIGVHDYLGESKRKRLARTRGANFTSADFIFRFRTTDGGIQIVLGEWKYTEEYRPLDKGIEVRKRNYSEAFHRSGGVFKRRDEDLYDALFLQPFYQLMRLQLLAQEMEHYKEMDANIVSVLYICPEANTEFRDRVTSPYLASKFQGKGTFNVWTELVHGDRFTSRSMEDILDTITHQAESVDREWVNYLRVRYGPDGLA